MFTDEQLIRESASNYQNMERLLGRGGRGENAVVNCGGKPSGKTLNNNASSSDISLSTDAATDEA